MSGLSVKGIILVICVILLVGVSGTAIYLFKNARDNAENYYRNRINELEDIISSNTKEIYCSKEYLPEGTLIKTDMFVKKEILSNSSEYADQFDMGAVLKTDLKPGCELTKSMISKQEIKIEEREVEFDFIRIPVSLSEGDYADIRIRYPDGTDYVVAAKKKMIHIDSSAKTVSLYLCEEELLLLDSAMLDTLRYDGSVLYLTKYIMPDSDMASKVNYIPSVQLEKLMSDNPNILKRTVTENPDEKRSMLEELLSKYMTENIKYMNRGNTEINETTVRNGGSVWD